MYEINNFTVNSKNSYITITKIIKTTNLLDAQISSACRLVDYVFIMYTVCNSRRLTCLGYGISSVKTIMETLTGEKYQFKFTQLLDEVTIKTIRSTLGKNASFLPKLTNLPPP